MTNMIPGLWMILVSIFLPVIPQYFRQPVMLLSVAASALSLLNGFGVFVEWEILGNTLILDQADNLTLPFALIFFCNLPNIYSESFFAVRLSQKVTPELK